MKQIISYKISKTSPGWPGNPTVSIDQITSIEKGDIANTYLIHLFNHFGTHLDAPLHFNGDGISINEIPFETFFYKNPLLIEIIKGANEKIIAEDLVPYEKKIAGCDLLMIRTGYGMKRMQNPREYMEYGPSLGSSASKYLMDHFSDLLKAVALDFISLASYNDTFDGNLSHQFMLGKFHKNKYICIIEDVNMQDLKSESIKSAAAIPLFVEGIDSSPVTMWVEI